MDTMSKDHNNGMFVELAGNASIVTKWIIANPRGFQLSKAAEALGIPERKLYYVLRSLETMTSSIKCRTRKGFVKARFTPASLVVSGDALALPTMSMGVVKMANVLQVSRSQQPSNGQTQATEVAWPAMPDIPDTNLKYAWFEKPEFYDRMKSKVVVHGKHVRLKGPPGIGKSSAVEYMAADEGRVLVNINADAGLRARHLIGGMTDLGRFEVAQFASAVVHGDWAKIDEANGADPDAILCLNSILAPPFKLTINGINYPVHSDFRLFISYNPGLVGTKPLPDSLKDRFYPIDVSFPAEAQLRKMLIANGVDEGTPEVETLIRFALKVALERRDRRTRFDITVRRLLDAWTDIRDGISVYKALLASTIYAIDDDQTQIGIKKILDEMVAH